MSSEMELDPGVLKAHAEKEIAEAETNGTDIHVTMYWKSVAELCDQTIEEQKQRKLTIEELRWYFKDAVARCLLQRLILETEASMKAIPSRVFATSILEHVEGLTFHENILDLIEEIAEEEFCDNPHLPRAVGTGTFHIPRRMREILHEMNDMLEKGLPEPSQDS